MAIGQIPITKQNSKSGASGPAKAAPSVNYSESKLGEGQVKTVTDGRTKVITSTGESTGSKAGDDISRGARQAYFNKNGNWPPCINTDCKSYGRPHPNCLCFGPMSQAGKFEYAHGGCVGSHLESCEHYADGGQIEENNNFANYPQNSLDHTAVQHGLLHLLTKLGTNGQSPNPHKHIEDYMNDSKRGKKTIESHVPKLIGKEKLEVEPKEDIEGLKSHLNDIQADPEKALEIGGHLGEALPNHAAALGAKSANAINYFQGLKPMPSQTSPLDPITPPSRVSKMVYDRQLKIAQNPMLILRHVKDGTIEKQDLITLHTIYPALGQSLTTKAAETLIEAKEKKLKLSSREKQGLSLLLGQPLDTSQTPQSMQAIIRANASSQPQPQQKQSKKASGTELKQIDKTNSLYATSSQDRQVDQRK